MIDLEEAAKRIGDRVAYVPAFGGRKEEGKITSVLGFYIFVKFNPLAEYGQACYPRDLEWAE
jgi:ribosomal protein L35AE/L33A